MKTCYVCGEAKPLDEFGNNRAKKDGKTEECKPCKREQTRAWKQRNKDKVREYQREYMAENRDRVLAWKKASRERNPDTARQWWEDNKDRKRQYNLNRRGYNADPRLSIHHLEFHGACLKCGSTENLEIDHVVPLSLGGSNEQSNWQVLCKSCNCSKGNRNTEDYRFWEYEVEV